MNTVVYDRPLGDDSGDPVFFRMYHNSRGRFEVVFEVIVGVGFGGFLSFCGDYENVDFYGTSDLICSS